MSCFLPALAASAGRRLQSWMHTNDTITITVKIMPTWAYESCCWHKHAHRHTWYSAFVWRTECTIHSAKRKVSDLEGMEAARCTPHMAGSLCEYNTCTCTAQ